MNTMPPLIVCRGMKPLMILAALILAGCAMNQDITRAERMMQYGTPAERQAARAYLLAEGAKSDARLNAMDAAPQPAQPSWEQRQVDWDAADVSQAIREQTEAIQAIQNAP